MSLLNKVEMLTVCRALSFNFEYLIRLDSDGQHPAHAIGDMINALKKSDVCITYRKNQPKSWGRQDLARILRHHGTCST